MASHYFVSSLRFFPLVLSASRSRFIFLDFFPSPLLVRCVSLITVSRTGGFSGWRNLRWRRVALAYTWVFGGHQITWDSVHIPRAL
ncbi:hypothetical protein BXZ70DRAFT_944925 [Cristinia sonorae]|uniref:Uncharacterized protein n=1 Tax=Cristinia sonorae TaxID=1940300 RepID=A0A8K0ULU8_9AGAR|nr:hypothetical protein BXZ70DRAFT_944925 [Cristinia sonorae]